MSEIFGGGRNRRGDAQEHAYEAMDAMANEDWDRFQELGASLLTTKAQDDFLKLF